MSKIGRSEFLKSGLSFRIRFLFTLVIGVGLVNILKAQECSDKLATPATKTLYKNLHRLQSAYIIFGQQDALAYGVGWKNISGQSDISLVVNDQPGMYGWDIAHIEIDAERNIDGVPFSKIIQYIQEGYQRGAAITLSWHAKNPLTGGSAWDTAQGTVACILPGGSKHALFKQWLDRVAVFLNKCRDKSGTPIPILFRPFHELTGNWFWWCKNVCTAEEFKTLWKFTFDYLIKEKKIHHLLFVYNTAGFLSQDEYTERYPGDNVVDVLSMDSYQHLNTPVGRENFINNTRKQLMYIKQLATEKNKLVAFAETGLEAVPDARWWTQALLPAIKDIGISYVLVWRNHGYMGSQKKMHYYAPYPGQVSAIDFKLFYNQHSILFESKLKAHRIYKR